MSVCPFRAWCERWGQLEHVPVGWSWAGRWGKGRGMEMCNVNGGGMLVSVCKWVMESGGACASGSDACAVHLALAGWGVCVYGAEVG